MEDQLAERLKLETSDDEKERGILKTDLYFFWSLSDSEFLLLPRTYFVLLDFLSEGLNESVKRVLS